MNMIELVVITVGISLDIFAAVECEGAKLAKINKLHVLQVSLAAVFCQSAALVFGHLGANLLSRYDMKENLPLTACTLSAAIFIILGVRLLLKAWKNEAVQEHLSKDGIGKKDCLRLIILAAVYTILTGVALGLLQTSIFRMLLLMVLATAAAVVLGIYTGYCFGYEQKTKAYAAGGILLLLSGLDVVVRYVVR